MSVLEELADVADGVLRHELRARIEVGGRDATVDLQIELHDRPEALEERLLAERAAQVATLEARLLGRAEVEAIRAELAGQLGLPHSLGERGSKHPVRREDADDVATRLDE